MNLPSNLLKSASFAKIMIDCSLGCYMMVNKLAWPGDSFVNYAHIGWLFWHNCSSMWSPSVTHNYFSVIFSSWQVLALSSQIIWHRKAHAYDRDDQVISFQFLDSAELSFTELWPNLEEFQVVSFDKKECLYHIGINNWKKFYGHVLPENVRNLHLSSAPKLDFLSHSLLSNSFHLSPFRAIVLSCMCTQSFGDISYSAWSLSPSQGRC